LRQAGRVAARLDRLAPTRLAARRLLPGIVIGSYVSVRVPETVLRFTLATTLLLIAGRFVL
jgi:uncharacterized membrane protein YfcA